MVSIIVTVCNQLGMNRLFYEYLKRNTSLPYELIVVDNHSTDGSREFFRERADVMIENDANYSYPRSQNQGIAVARYDYLIFINNDVLVTRDWDKRLIETMNHPSGGGVCETVCACSNDHLEGRKAQRRLNNHWKRIKYPLRFLFGTRYASLRAMVCLTYGNLNRLGERRWEKFGTRCIEGFNGSCVAFKRTILDKVGLWDERIQAGDFDYFCMVKERSLTVGDLRPMQVALGVFVHHFQRLTERSKHVEFADRPNIITLEAKWGDRMPGLMKDIVE